jgi:hypothetical protein
MYLELLGESSLCKHTYGRPIWVDIQDRGIASILKGVLGCRMMGESDFRTFATATIPPVSQLACNTYVNL